MTWLPIAEEVPANPVVPYPILPPNDGEVTFAIDDEVYPILPPNAGEVAFTNADEVPYPTLLPTAGVVELVNTEFPYPTLAIDEEPNGICVPCGYCRQFMSEFVNKDFKIVTVEQNGNVKEFTLEELLPYNFNI